MKSERFTLNEFIAQMGQVRRLGSMERILRMIPGMKDLTRRTGMTGADVERQMAWMHGIYHAMTEGERLVPDAVDGRRRRRIARGAGVGVQAVHQFFQQFDQTRNMMRVVRSQGL